MMKHKTAELEGALLDAAVAKAEGADWSWTSPYSTSWEQGGPIIEREGITVMCNTSSLGRPYWLWEAHVQAEFDGGTLEHSIAEAEGPTPLIAAMRAYIASRFGDEVELP